MRSFYLIFFFLISLVSSGQLTCNNWLSLTSYPSYFRIGDLDISGNKITVEGVLNRTQPYLPGGLHDSEGEIVSKHTDPSNVNYILRPNHAYITTTNGFFGTPDVCGIELNKTYHVAMVYDGITLKFYRNGFLMSQVAATGNLIQNNFNTQVGLYDATVWRTQFLGYINEIRIWNVARTQAEIRTYMNSSLPNPTTQTGLLAYYTFDDLLNKQGNPLWNGILSGSGAINATNPNCSLIQDSCAINPCNNIDSVRFNNTATGCSTFNFEGLGYTNTNPINNWQWYFGDGNTASTQNTSHTYSVNGTYTVKLIVTDINGCKDSISRSITAGNVLDFDFTYKPDVCNPLSVQFTGVGTDIQNPYWSFGDATTTTGSINPVHLYTANGNYIVRYSVSRGTCSDTISKTITLSVIQEDIILTKDTTICAGTTKQLRTNTSLGFCWSPATYLDNPNSANPITSTPQSITYYYTAEIPGTNIITNGNFSNGNTGFTSAYNFATPNVTEGQYFVGTSPQAWNASLSNCTDHTTGTGNMMLVNGAPAPDVKVWTQTVTVTPNTNYAFSTWIQALWPPNPAQLQFSINDNDIGTLITASLPTCTWTQFYTTWNSGNNTTASISIVNKNTQVIGNDFALDDISFSPVLIKRDSVIITVETPAVVATNSTAICEGTSIQLNATGASTYSWTSGSSLSNPNIANPIATPVTNTRYIVSGTTATGCVAKDTVDIAINPKPLITKSNNDTICVSTSAQLLAGGGVAYSWSPATTLDNPSIPNPVATPTSTTKYFVTVTGANTCNNIDSIEISVRTPNSFTINPPVDVCRNSTVQLNASGGDVYSWQPAASLDNPLIANPFASPQTTSTYSVLINDTTCGFSRTLSTAVVVLPLPIVRATKSNDIDCSSNQSHLTATGAIQYNWSPAATLNNANAPNPVATPLTTTKYIVSGTGISGCTNTDSTTVNVNITDNANYLMPTAFTPNNDGKNDCYGVKFWGIVQEIDFSIYNRWGERIFHSTKVGDCWNGTYKGVPQNTAVFVYVISAKTTCQPTVFRKGTFALIR